MSTPPEQPTDDTPASPPATPPARPTPAPPPAATPAVANPFVPVVREPWVNPNRRTHVAGVGIAALLVALGGGIGIGLAIGDGHHREHPRGIMLVPGRYGYGAEPGIYGRVIGPPPGYQPGGTASVAPAPTPAPSSTG
jgi:hypothetical protein